MIYKSMPEDLKRIKDRYAYTCEYTLHTIKSGVQKDIHEVITITSNKKMNNEDVHKAINDMLGIQIDDRQTGYDNYDVVQLKSSSVVSAYDKNIK